MVYKIEIKTINGWRDSLIIDNPNFSFISKLDSFHDLNDLKSMIDITRIYLKNESEVVEYISNIDSFIRVSKDKVYFGQYVDENLAELEEFKLFLEEGEKNFGNLHTKDFLPIVQKWYKYLKEKNRANH